MSPYGCSAVVGGVVGVGVLQNVREKRSSKNSVFAGKIQEKRPEIFEISGLGGDKRDRTADLLNAIQALSQSKRLHTPPTGHKSVSICGGILAALAYLDKSMDSIITLF